VCPKRRQHPSIVGQEKRVAEVIEQYKEKLRTISDVSRAHLESVCTKLFPGFKSVMRVVVMFARFNPVERPQPYAVPTERRVRLFNTPASYSGGPVFKSQP
jgi:hypothetical protein